MNSAASQMARTSSPVRVYGAAAAALTFATLLRMALAPLVGGGVPFAVYFVAVLLMAWYGGFAAAAFTLAVSTAAGTYFFLAPAALPAAWFETRADRVTVLGYVMISLVLSFLIDRQRKTLLRIEEEAAHRREAEAAERQQREWFETTLASIGDAVIATDAEGKVTFLNHVAGRLTGWDVKQARGAPLREVFRVVNEQTGAEVYDPLDMLLREGRSIELANHTVLIARDGRRIPLEDSGAPILRDGRTQGAVLVFRDVTERRKAQKAILRSERRYRMLFERNPEPMWVYDRETLKFLAVNHAAQRQYGYSAKEFLEMTIKEIRPPEDIPALMVDVQRQSRTMHQDGPWRHRKRDGTLISVEITAHPLQYEGRNACLVLARDVTERKRLEEQYLQAQRLESVGRLAGGVAHDFNNLLTVINSYAAMILDDLPATPSLRHRVTEIGAAGGRAAELTEQLLAFSRKQVIQPAILNLNEVIAGFENIVRRLIGEDIELNVKPAFDLGNISADAGQLRQVIMNLAVNARDAMPQGGSLLIETSNVWLDEGYRASHPEVRPGPYVMLAVSDTGMGMTPDVQQRIFEPFFTTKPPGSGTGLGLALVHGIVRQSGGWIWVYSEPGVGTSFKVYLPGTQDTAGDAPEIPKAEVRGHETILVVEDQNDVRNLAVLILERYGYRVLSAAGGEEAMSLASQFPDDIHLLLTDVVMPGMDGRTLARRLAAVRNMRVLFMSGYTENAVTHRGILNAALHYLQKPFTPDSLAQKVREVLGEEPSR